jgi:hypothetical protein
MLWVTPFTARRSEPRMLVSGIPLVVAASPLNATIQNQKPVASAVESIQNPKSKIGAVADIY